MLVTGSISFALVSRNEFMINLSSNNKQTNNKKLFNKFLALTAFGLDPDSMGNTLLFDNTNTQISEDIFRVIVPQFLRCNNFAIKMGLKSDANEPLIVQVCSIHTINSLISLSSIGDLFIFYRN